MRQQIYLVVPILLLVVSIIQVYGVPIGGGIPHHVLARQLMGRPVKILHVHLGKYVEVNDTGAVSATAQETGSNTDFELEPGQPFAVPVTFKFKSTYLTDKYLGLTEDNHITTVDSSDQTAITEFILENNNKYFLRANKAGASCYIAFETSDMDLGMPVDNPCEVDPHIDQDKALLGLNFSR